MNSGDVFSDSVRRSVVAELAGDLSGLDVDVEQDFGVVADETDRRREKFAHAVADRSSIS